MDTTEGANAEQRGFNALVAHESAKLEKSEAYWKAREDAPAGAVVTRIEGTTPPAYMWTLPASAPMPETRP